MYKAKIKVMKTYQNIGWLENEEIELQEQVKGRGQDE